MIRQLLAFPLYPPPRLSQVSSIEALYRHFQLAVEYGTNPVAAEYLAEIARREAAINESREAA